MRSQPSSQSPWLSVGGVKQVVGLIVILESLDGRVPSQFTAKPVGDVAEVAPGGDAVSDLDIHHGPAAGGDAVKPVGRVAVAALQLCSFWRTSSKFAPKNYWLILWVIDRRYDSRL